MKPVTMTVLVEDTVHTLRLRGEHGWSVLVESDGRRMLFDTGQSNLLLQNARALRADIGEVEAIVLSHGHYDHTGGLKALAKKVPETKLIAHPDVFAERYARTKKGEMLKAGCPLPEEGAKSMFTLDLTKEEKEIIPGVWTTGRIRRGTDYEDVGGAFFRDRSAKELDELHDDLALFMETPRGLVVLLGCAHAGVVNTLNRVARLTGKKKIFAVIGGMHLIQPSADRLVFTVDAFRKFGVERIGIGHCTGFCAAKYFWSEFGDGCFFCNAGTRVTFDA